MTPIHGWTHAAFPIDDSSRIGEARRHAAQLIVERGWSEVDAGRLALVITELGTNLLRHAERGFLLVALRAGYEDVEVLAIDEGPGIGNIAASMRDGFSTGSDSPGTGLGALRRLADDFDLHSTVPLGTICLARVRKAGTRAAPAALHGFELGAICLPLTGEKVCGDAWGFAADDASGSLVVADGLGHGPEAARAAQAAIEAFAEAPQAELRAIVERVHERLQTTRGAALAVLRLADGEEALRCAGAGNISVRVMSGTFDRSLATQHGTAGLQIRRPDESRMTLPPHALVVAHSDGIASRWDSQQLLPLLGRDPALLAALLLRLYSRGRDDATVVVWRRKEAA